MNTLGNRIRQRRIELKLTQEELGKMVGYTSRTTVNKVELGISLPNQPKIELFAKALNTTPSYLMGWTDNYNDNINKENQELFNLIQQLTDDEVKELSSFVDYLISKRKN